MGWAKKFEISQGSYELFFIMCIYDEKKRVTKKIKRFYVLSQIRKYDGPSCIMGNFTP
jgi:hypothetical protein